MNYFLGIDQGGTSTRIAVCDVEGRFAGVAAGAASIFYLDDSENKSTLIVRQLAENILAEAGLTWDCLSAAYGGLTGVDWPHEAAIHTARLREGLGLDDATAVNDCLIALRAGSTAANRCIVCAGTGLNIGVHAEDGAESTCGYYIPHRLQGGGALGGAAVEAVIEEEAGVGAATLLNGALLELSGCASVEEFLIGITTRKLSFAPQSLSPEVFKAAGKGDAVASRIVADFSEGVGAYLENAISRHLPRGCDAELVFSGGVFKGVGRMAADRIAESLAQKFPRLRFVNARLEPVCGALLMLLDRHYSVVEKDGGGNGGIPPGVMKNFEQGCARYGLIRK